MPHSKTNEFFDSPNLKFNGAFGKHNTHLDFYTPFKYGNTHEGLFINQPIQYSEQEPEVAAVENIMAQDNNEGKNKPENDNRNSIRPEDIANNRDAMCLQTPLKTTSKVQPSIPMTTANINKGQLKNYTFKKKDRTLQKGLRKLAGMAFELVKNIKTSTYKDVANLLIAQLNQTSTEIGCKNTKRRVYDVLNVLLAANVINRKGNKISHQRLAMFSKGKAELKEEELEREANSLRQKIKAKQAAIQEKKASFKLLQEKQSNLRKLVQYNQKRSLLKDTDKRKLMMPYIVMSVPAKCPVKSRRKDLGDINYLKFPISADNFTLSCSSDVKLFGDVDTLRFHEALHRIDSKKQSDNMQELIEPFLQM